MALEEILASAKQTLLERITSPLLGSFFLAWCAWNWRFLVVLFSDTSVPQTFALVDNQIYPDLVTFLAHAVFFPMLSAAVYIFIYPYPARFVYAFTLRRQRETNQIKQQIADETPLTLEESLRLRSEYVAHERKNTETVQRLNEEIARLNAALDASVQPETKPDVPAPRLSSPRLEPSQVTLLQILEKGGPPVLEAQLVGRSPEGRVKTDFDIGELERLGYLKRGWDSRRDEHTLDFTHEGRRALLENHDANAKPSLADG